MKANRSRPEINAPAKYIIRNCCDSFLKGKGRLHQTDFSTSILGIKSCRRNKTKSTTPSVLKCNSRWISYLVWTHLITNRFRKDELPLSDLVRVLSRSSINHWIPSHLLSKTIPVFFAIPSGIQKQNRPRNQIKNICFLHRDRLSSQFGTAIGKGERLAGCRAASWVAHVFFIAYRLVFWIQRIHRRCLNPNPRVNRPSCLRCRPVRTLRTDMSVSS